MTTQPSDAGPGLTPELEEAIRRGYAQRDRADMGPTIAYFDSLLAGHPGHPVLVYEVAGAYDTAGQEEKARELSERALDLGLAGDTLRRCLCQYGSTLRWLGQYDKSLAALDRAKRRWAGIQRGPRLPRAHPERRRPQRRGRRRAHDGDHGTHRGHRPRPLGARAARRGPVASQQPGLTAYWRMNWNPADRREFTGAH